MAEIPPPLLRAPPSEGETHTHGEGGAFCHGLPSVLHKSQDGWDHRGRRCAARAATRGLLSDYDFPRVGPICAYVPLRSSTDGDPCMRSSRGDIHIEEIVYTAARPLPGRRRVPRVIAVAYSVFGFSTLLSAVPAHIPLKSGSGIHGPSSSQAKFSFHMQSFLHHDGSSRGRSKPPL